MEIYVKFLLFPHFLFFWFSIMILTYTLILPVSQLQTQQLMTWQIMSHIKYLIPTAIFLCSFCTEIWWQIWPHRRCSMRFNDDSW